MEYNDFSIDTPWCLEPGAITTMMGMMPRIVTPEQIQQAATGVPGRDEYTPDLTITRNVAVIPLAGYLSKRTTLFSVLMGAANLNRFVADLTAARENPRVRGIVLYIDSPGGPVSMVPEVADMVYQVRQDKPVITYSDGALTSGAYWIGGAASRVVTSPVAQAGSIGVVVMHVDFSQMNQAQGVKYTYITAGKYKAEGNEDEPLSDAARRRIEVRLNDTYEVFINAVSRFRNTSAEVVRSDMAEGRMFVGQRAIDAGLVDSLGNLDDAIDLAGSGDATAFYRDQIQTQEEEEITMPENTITTLEELQAAYPDLCRQLSEQAADGVSTESAVSDAVSRESDRILGLARIHFGQEAADRFTGVVSGGVTVEQYQAMAAALQPPAASPAASDDGEDPPPASGQDAQFRQQMLNGIQNASAPDVGAGGSPSGGPATFLEAVNTIVKEQQCSQAQAMSIAAKKHPDLHQAYIDAANA